MKKKYAIRVAMAISILALTGCAATKPWVKMSPGETSAHPTLNRALKNSEISSKWVTFTGSSSLAYSQKQNKERETEFFYQSVGPAPFIVGRENAAKIHLKSSSGLHNSIALSQIATSAAFPSLGGGISAGGMALGIAGLLLGGGSSVTHLTGLNTFETGQTIYAVKFFPNEAAANSFIPKAAELEANLPAKFSGATVGHTSWEDLNTTWEPYKTIIGTGPGNSFELVYKMLPRALPPESVDYAPVAVWDDCLRPVLKHGYVITDQWAVGTLSNSQQESDERQLSKEYPKWNFLLARSASVKNLNSKIPNPILCTDGKCTEVEFKDNQ